ncbi:nuclear matrix constituent protein 1a-like isoform X2 [Lytechinus variegatus]|uniref:nuclear matrix constituent protein 1a-like isoform X2 n=1 Tax=Lytechinus variegatus TaxID=7654 RepID=UPI001BB18C65|nr:nuclear matrix constituent protein 1a-like isoform X2 [Lytechinus variegatus]
MASDVSDVCQKLQGVQLQLSLVLTRNEDVLKHLEEVEKIFLKNGSSTDRENFSKSIRQSRLISSKLEESIQTQCTSIGLAVTELEKRSADAEESSAAEKSGLEFQLKSQLNHNVLLHKEKAELETRLKEHMGTLKESGKQADKLEEEIVETKKQMKNLLDMFEEKAVEAENRIGELHEAMERTQEKANQYQAMYEAEKESNYRFEKEHKEREKNRFKMENGDDEGDGLGPVLISRPQTSVKRSKSTPIDPYHIDPQYQSVMEENKALKAEVDRLVNDNVHLLKKSKQAQRDIETIQNHVATCSGQRDELRRRLKKEQEEKRKLSSSMTRQASDWIMQKKMVKDIEHYSKAGKIQPESTLSASVRYRSHPIKVNEDKPRNIPVESWSSENPLRAV